MLVYQHSTEGSGRVKPSPAPAKKRAAPVRLKLLRITLYIFLTCFKELFAVAIWQQLKTPARNEFALIVSANCRWVYNLKRRKVNNKIPVHYFVLHCDSRNRMFFFRLKDGYGILDRYYCTVKYPNVMYCTYCTSKCN